MALAVACNDSVVPFLTAPSRGGDHQALPGCMTRAVSGLFEGPRADMGFGINVGFMNVVTGYRP